MSIAQLRTRLAIRKKLLNEQTIIGYLFLLPMTIAFIAFTFYPVLYSFQLSLAEWSGFGPRTSVGLSNYAKLLGDREAREALINTIYYALGHVPLTIAAGLLAALVVNQKLRGRAILRTLFYTPSITPYVAASIVWIYVLNTDWGILNWFLHLFHLPSPDWLGSPRWAMLGVIIFTVWKGFGYHMMIFLAGLQSIPAELYEAAKIDGAGRWNLFRHITWPLLTPTTFFLLIMSIISSFKVFTSVYVMTQGGPAGSTTVLVYLIYQHAFQFFRMGYASAMSYVLFAIVLLLTFVQFRFAGRRVHYMG